MNASGVIFLISPARKKAVYYTQEFVQKGVKTLDNVCVLVSRNVRNDKGTLIETLPMVL